MNIHTQINGLDWTVRNDHPIWPPLLAAATTIGHTTVFDSGLCPDSVSLAHEWFHVSHTSWLRYLVSFTIGRLWGSDYWRLEESGANLYAINHQNDAPIRNLAAQVRSQVPSNIPLVTINHPVQ